MIDRFGKDVILYPNGESTVRVVAGATRSGTFFGWLTQFGSKVHIDAPDDLREEYVKYLGDIISAAAPFGGAPGALGKKAGKDV
jgi:predicted DNA-binding transcriptional regulator YafY